VIIRDSVNDWSEVMGFGIVLALRPGERYQKISEATPGNNRKRLPIIKVGKKSCRDSMFPQVTEGPAC
jgi:hypothetical protein